MPTTIKKLEKRDGRVKDFKPEKIAQAIYKATEAVGESNFELAKELCRKVIEFLEKKLSPEKTPTIEEVQDMVEKVLIESGQARVAKAYILYRQKRAEIRKEKQLILNKTEIDEVDKRFDINALRVLKSRYLRKEPSGKVIESPKQLFERVALHATLPSLFYSSKVFQERGNQHPENEFNPKEWVNKIRIGRFALNLFHLEALKSLYDRFNHKGQIKMNWPEFIGFLQKGEFDEYEKEIKEYYDLMSWRKFLPNTPALINFGRDLGMGSACFCLDVEDSIESIMGTLVKAAIIFKSGGGVGYNFSKLRPTGDFVSTTGGVSSGPITFMTLYDKMSDVVKQGGARRGASMGILNSDHPNIEEFITAKKGNQQLRNFNISVLIRSDFWDYYKEGKPYPLINPKDKQILKYADPRALFDLIVYQAWESAEPGMLFEDRINQYNPFLKTLGPIQCTNPCSELPLYPNSSCNLGSINVWSFVKSSPTNGREKQVEFDWQDFEKTIKTATKFLDNVIEVNKFPLPEIAEMSLKVRRIGLGLMGLGDLLYDLEIPYASKEGLAFMERLMEFLNYHSKVISMNLAKERGKFPYYEKSFYSEGKLPFRGRGQRAGELPLKDKKESDLDWDGLTEEIKEHGLRNSQTTTNAPTGSISMIAGCSSGIEPCFSLVYEKKVAVGSFYYVDPVFEKVMLREGLFDEDLIKDISRLEGSCKSINYIPPKFKKIFVTAMDLSAEDHIMALATLQRWTDSSISKTINFPATATIEQMRDGYLLAHQLGCKGLAVFRYKSMPGVLSAGKRKEKKPETEEKEEKLIGLRDVKAKGPSIYQDPGAYENNKVVNNNSELCPKCKTALIRAEGCKKCPSCGWGLCSSG